jgi:glycosyltransferase involved in cell wall biosynthesis
MKILMVAMPSLHFFRWTEQLKNAGHEVFWFDIVDGGQKVERIGWVNQIVGWKLKWNFPGRSYLKANLPKVYKFIQKINDCKTDLIFEKVLNEVKPDVVHSFALYVACTPIIEVMERHRNLKWIYSSWGSDLFYFQNNPFYLKDIKRVLPRIDFLFTDCNRDFEIAKTQGFLGEFLGVFPGGGGFPLEEMDRYALPFEQREIILIKGLQGRSGRAISVLKAVQKLKKLLTPFKIVVFGADKEVIEYITSSELAYWNNFSVLGKITQKAVWQLMGKTLIYVGNSNSDGIPNTLLEAICIGVFPVQSNPGGSTKEIIEHGVNGLLIEDCEDVNEIKNNIIYSINTPLLLQKASFVNTQFKANLSYQKIQSEVIAIYKQINDTKN